MKYYVIFATDNENSLEKRLHVRAIHLARLEELKQQNRLLTAGPTPLFDDGSHFETGFSGSIVIAQFNSLDEAKTWANEDPYVQSGVYQEIIVKPFLKVF